MDWKDFYKWLLEECGMTREQFNEETDTEQRSRLYEDYNEYKKTTKEKVESDTLMMSHYLETRTDKSQFTVHATEHSLKSIAKLYEQSKSKNNGLF